MKIVLNATCLNSHPSGARNRFVGIYQQIFKLCPEVDFIVFEPKDCSISSWFSRSFNVRYIKTGQSSENSIQRYLSGKLFWSRELNKINPDIFETYHLPLVKSPAGRTILTVHDIRYLRFPHLYSPFRRVVSRSLLRSALLRSDLVITVSNAIKKEILDFCPKANVKVIHNGIDPEAYHSLSGEDLSKIKESLNLPQKFILSVGHLEKRKNYPRLLEAISSLNLKGNNLFLCIVGNEGDDSKAILDKINELKLINNVKLLKNLTDHEVRGLYRLCSLFVFPSLYEGFGIPIIEAMAAQCPMVLSDLPVFREITENQSLYFNENDPELMARAILKAYDSASEQKRLIEYGTKRVEMFKYDKLARDLKQIYFDGV